MLVSSSALSFSWDTGEINGPFPRSREEGRLLSYSQLRMGFLLVQEEGSFPAVDDGGMCF